MKRSFAVLLAIAAAAVTALPAGAETVGDRIDLASPPATFTAGEPFYIQHGWGWETGEAPYQPASLALGKLQFTLAVDGEVIEPTFVWRTVDDDRLFWQRWIFNFPDGLSAGTHRFTGTWSGPCMEMVHSNLYFGTCEQPTEVVVAIGPLTRTIEFTP